MTILFIVLPLKPLWVKSTALIIAPLTFTPPPTLIVRRWASFG
jgi:hypothetical protein